MRRRLTPQQALVVDAAEHGVLVRACPGAGKTTTAARRLGALSEGIHPGRHVVGLSFTRAGANELARAVSEAVPGLLSSGRVLVSTVDSFLDRFIVRPFAHQVFKTSHPLRVVTEPSVVHRATAAFHIGAAKDRKGAWDIDARYRGDWTVEFSVRGRQRPPAPARKAVANWFRAGNYSHRHRAFLASTCLRKLPFLRSALQARLAHLLIDEFQDTSAQQQHVLEFLHTECQVPTTVLGDPNQSIYAFRGANPAGFHRPASEWGCVALRLDTSFRCSEAIANLLSALAPADRVVGRPDSQEAPMPVGVVHPTDDLAHALSRFKEVLVQHQIPQCDAVVLVRGHGQLAGLVRSQAESLTGLAKILGQAASKRDTERDLFGATKEIFRALQHVGVDSSLMAPAALGHPDLADSATALRHAVCLFVAGGAQGLPPASLNVDEWVPLAKLGFEHLCASLGLDKSSLNLGRRITRRGKLDLKRPVASGALDGWDVRTIHSSKGLTFRAVLVLGSGKFMTMALGQAGTGALDGEESRLLYVGLSRAHTLLCWGIPRSTHRRHGGLLAGLPLDIAP